MPHLNEHKLTQIERLQLAKERTGKLVDQLRWLIQLHESNAIIVYSSQLAGKVPFSHAANAFKIFQNSMHGFEVVRLSAMWDKPDRDGVSIPTIVSLIDDPQVRESIVGELRCHWMNMGWVPSTDPSDDPAMQMAVEKVLRESQNDFAEKQATDSEIRLNEVIAKSKKILASDKLKSVLNHRHKYLAHSLTETSLEKKGAIEPMKYGDDNWLFEQTLDVVDGLHITVNGAGFAWDHAQEISQRNASSLWESCQFNIEH